MAHEGVENIQDIVAYEGWCGCLDTTLSGAAPVTRLTLGQPVVWKAQGTVWASGCDQYPCYTVA
jgi:hypothetical protein